MSSAERLPTAIAASLGWRDRLAAWRDGLVAQRRFQRWAASFPLTRPLVRRRALDLFDLMAGFVYSQVLLAAVRTRLFEHLADGPKSLPELAQLLNLPERGAQRLLDACNALRLTEPRGEGRYGLGALGAPMPGNEAVAAMVEHHCALYADLRDPVALLRGEPATAMAACWPYVADDRPGELRAEHVASYSGLMSASQPMVTDELLACYRLQAHRHLLDVGGGEGRFVRRLAAEQPHLQLSLVDLPAVAERARAALAADGLAGRVQAHGADFFRDALPAGADVVTLIRVLFDHDDVRVQRLLRSIRQAMAPGGTLLVAEPMRDTAGAQAMGDAYFGLYLLAMGRGRPRSIAEHRELLLAAGFRQVRVLRNPMPLHTRVLAATA
jgi:demethylspheroidene O-methyltransferase